MTGNANSKVTLNGSECPEKLLLKMLSEQSLGTVMECRLLTNLHPIFILYVITESMIIRTELFILLCIVLYK